MMDSKVKVILPNAKREIKNVYIGKDKHKPLRRIINIITKKHELNVNWKFFFTTF